MRGAARGGPSVTLNRCVAVVEPLQVQNHFPNLRGEYAEPDMPIEAAMSPAGRHNRLTVTGTGAISEVAYSKRAASAVSPSAGET